LKDTSKESLAAQLRAAAERITNAGESTDDVMQAFHEVARGDLGRLQPAELFARFAYVASSDAFFDLVTRRFFHRKAFDAVYRHVKCQSVHDSKPCRPSVAFDESRAAMNGLTAWGTTYAPGFGALVARSGAANCNIWLDGRQTGKPGDCTPWLRHFETLVPDPAMRAHMLNVMAHKVQRPNVKINHGMMLSGIPGSGKDSLFAPFLWAIGGDDLRNVQIVRNEEVISAFNYSVESEVMVINELRMVHGSDIKALENFLKPALAAPPELIPINKKQEHPYYALNRCLVIAFSNERKPITISPDDRRWFVHWTDAPRMTEDDAQALWDWYMAGGRDHVAHLLRTHDISRFNPAAPPMMTPAKAFLLHAAEHDVEAAIVRMAIDRTGCLSAGIAAGPWPAVCRAIESDLIARGMRCQVTHVNITAGLTRAGWVDRGRLAGTKLARRHIWTAPDGDTSAMSDSEIRRLAEEIWPTGLHLVEAKKSPTG